MKTIVVQMLPNEIWWGGTASPMSNQAYDVNTILKQKVSELGSQAAPLYLSSQGRYIWADSPLELEFNNGTITAIGKNVNIVQAGSTLRDAYLDAMKAHFPFEDKALPEKFFTTAQYNTWMEFTYNPTQKNVLEYAHAIIDNGYTPGILMIDEGWSVHYGTWDFDFSKFPNPKAMIDELHSLGFTVMLWIVPYVTADGREVQEHYLPWVSNLMGKEYKPRLVRDENNNVCLLKWWNGFSAMLNMANKNDVEYLDEKLHYLMETYGVDGFKFDGGNIASLRAKSWATNPPKQEAEELNKAWNDFGARYTYHEYKDTYDRGGRATIQRIRDKEHVWDGDNGLASLVPIALMQGLLGYPYICPDMIGGGEWSITLKPDFQCDEELFVRMAQCSALFPMMQFSWAPWRMLGEEAQKLCLDAAHLHGKYADKIIQLVNYARKTGEPIIRCMEYVYPHQGYEHIFDQFLLGEDILVCPVVEKGQRKRSVVLPNGRWRYVDGTIYTGAKTIEVDAPLEKLPYFEKV